MTRKEIYQAWIDYCKLVLPEWTITRAEQMTGKDGPRPDKPYLTLKIIAGPGRLAIDDNLIPIAGTDDSFNMTSLRSSTLSIRSFGRNDYEEHIDALELLSTCLSDPDKNVPLKKDNKIGIGIRGPVVELNGLVETGYEHQGSVDIGFNSVHNKVANIGSIENVEVSGSISGNANDDPIETNSVINKE